MPLMQSIDPLLNECEFRRPVSAEVSPVERRIRQVLWLTLVMMVVEIIAGMLTGSMALTVDGWHMSTHAAAFGISVLAYALARRHAHNQRFSFGVGKVRVLGAYTSALLLAAVGLAMLWQSGARLLQPVAIQYGEAIIVAVIGLLVNLVSVWLLRATKDDTVHGHSHAHSHHDPHAHSAAHAHHDHGHTQGDSNWRAAYLHVLADALVSVLAIIALVAGLCFGWNWADAVVGLMGSVVVLRWAAGLLRDTGAVLLDHTPATDLFDEIHRMVDAEPETAICDLHLWRLDDRHFACVLSLEATQPRTADYYRALLTEHEELVHVTVEVRGVSSS